MHNKTEIFKRCQQAERSREEQGGAERSSGERLTPSDTQIQTQKEVLGRGLIAKRNETLIDADKQEEDGMKLPAVISSAPPAHLLPRVDS